MNNMMKGEKKDMMGNYVSWHDESKEGSSRR